MNLTSGVTKTVPCKLSIMDNILVTESRRFVADHYHSAPSFKEQRHGHNWEIEATVGNGGLVRLGTVLDTWIENFDYSLLNEQVALKDRNPTAEVIAEHLFRHLEVARLCPIEVRVREKSHYWATCCLTNRQSSTCLARTQRAND